MLSAFRVLPMTEAGGARSERNIHSREIDFSGHEAPRAGAVNGAIRADATAAFAKQRRGAPQLQLLAQKTIGSPQRP